MQKKKKHIKSKIKDFQDVIIEYKNGKILITNRITGFTRNVENNKPHGRLELTKEMKREHIYDIIDKQLDILKIESNNIKQKLIKTETGKIIREIYTE